MKHLILTETTFFRRIRETEHYQATSDIQSDYENFIGCVTGLCCNLSDSADAYIALSYAEVELQHLGPPHISSSHEPYAGKALAFVRKMLDYVSKFPCPVPPLSSASTNNTTPSTTDTPAFRWTGKTSDLVEILYGIDELGCINNGEASLKDIAAYFYGILGVEAKDCYRVYADIKLRKNESRTYFLDRMQESVNQRMRMDEERERMRR